MGTLVTGLVFAMLAFFVGRRSKAALGFFSLSIGWLSLLAGPGGHSMIGSLIMHVFLIGTMARGLSAITQLRSRETSMGTVPAVAWLRGDEENGPHRRCDARRSSGRRPGTRRPGRRYGQGTVPAQARPDGPGSPFDFEAAKRSASPLSITPFAFMSAGSQPGKTWLIWHHAKPMVS